MFTLTPLLMIDKKGEKYLVYMHVFEKRIYVFAYMFCVLQIGEKDFVSFMLDWHVYLLIFAYMFI